MRISESHLNLLCDLVYRIHALMWTRLISMHHLGAKLRIWKATVYALFALPLLSFLSVASRSLEVGVDSAFRSHILEIS